jgi:hypothetical protein
MKNSATWRLANPAKEAGLQQTAPDTSVCGQGQHRGPDDDFFCLRYRVWYPSLDCAIRTRYRTCAGCRDCEQGRFNLKRHRAVLGRTVRFRPI